MEKKLRLFLLLALFFGISLISVGKAISAEINFSQSILPVKFIYLDNSGKIEKIWSNVAETDSLYVVRFFDYKKNSELNMNSGKLKVYLENTISYPNAASQRSERIANNSYQSLNVKIVKKNTGYEEIITLL